MIAGRELLGVDRGVRLSKRLLARRVIDAVVLVLLASGLVTGQAGSRADGRPDFEGIWNFATLTPLE